MSESILSLHSFTTSSTGLVVRAIGHSSHASHVYQDAVVPHRHDHYSCYLIAQGTAEVFVDFRPLQLTAHTLLISLPGQLHRVNPPEYIQGWVLLADAKLVEQPTRGRLQQLGVRPDLLYLSPVQYKWFENLFQLVQSATTLPLAASSPVEASHYLLQAGLAQAVHLMERQLGQQPQSPWRRSLALTQEFRQLLQQRFRTYKRPAAYAEELHVSTGHLNDTVKASTGFSASYFIQQEILAEAQRLLLYTDLPIREVASQLGYEDDKYFSRFFSKAAGSAPSLFRQQRGEAG